MTSRLTCIGFWCIYSWKPRDPQRIWLIWFSVIANAVHVRSPLFLFQSFHVPTHLWRVLNYPCRSYWSLHKLVVCLKSCHFDSFLFTFCGNQIVSVLRVQPQLSQWSCPDQSRRTVLHWRFTLIPSKWAGHCSRCFILTKSLTIHIIRDLAGLYQ